VSGGWAIDLFLDEVTREHEDVEVTIFRQDQEALREYFAGRQLYAAVEHEWVPWQEGESLALPIHQVLLAPLGRDPTGKNWEPSPGEIQFFLNEVDAGIWRFRRDPERITRPIEEMTVRSASGFPIVSPEVQLLFKAKRHEDRDQHDFEQVRGLLTEPQRAWLKASLEVVHPGDPWLSELD
jgi:Aminoglycoside-2''-adenylyltransferase